MMSRHRLAEDRIDQEDPADDHQRDADRPPRRVQQQQHTDAAEDGFDRNAVPDVEEAVAGDEPVPAEEQVGGHAPADAGTGDIPGRQAAFAEPSRHRIHQVADKQREREVKAARGDVADDGEVEHEREGRGDPELKDRPQEAEHTNEQCQPRPLQTPLVLDLLQGLVDIGSRGSRAGSAIRHGRPIPARASPRAASLGTVLKLTAGTRCGAPAAIVQGYIQPCSA